jgi:pimeloyl-ACP methyl ester carboxylesterase
MIFERQIQSSKRAAKITAQEIKANLYALNLYPLGVFGGKEKGIAHSKKFKNKHPILLVHGIVHNPSAFFKLRRRMDEAAWQNVFTVNYVTRHGSLYKMVEQLSKRVDQILEQTKSKQIDIIAHSLGGIIARLYLTGIGKGKVKNLVTLGTPHQGTQLSWFLQGVYPGTLSHDLMSGSYFLKDLAERKIPSSSKLTSFYTPHDILVWPKGNCLAVGFPKKSITNVEIPDVGHMGLLYLDRVIKQVMQTLV